MKELSKNSSRVLLFVLLSISSITLKAQSKLSLIKYAIENKMVVISRQWQTATYNPGSLKVTEVNEDDPKKLIVYGTISYTSENCGSVTTKIEVTLKQILDDIELTKTCISIPYCAWKAEYNREWKCY